MADAQGAGRRPAAREVALDWMDALLVAVSGIEPGATIEERAGALLDAAAKALPACAVGVCIPIRTGDQIVLRRSALPRRDGLQDPTRLFPELEGERVETIDTAAGSTLHIASDDEPLLRSAALDALAERLVLLLRATLRQLRTEEALRDQVIQSEKLASLGQIAAGIVHELNNPLTSILAYSDYLRRKGERAGSDPADLERLARIHEAADRILRFSRDLIAYSRPSTEPPSAVSLHDVIDRALLFCEHVLDKTGVHVEKSFGDVLPVLGVTGQLTQVFVNLFTNAAHAMRDHGGCLGIATEVTADGAHVTVTIRDDGHGIEREHLPRIFDPFFTTKTDGSGTGLGLSIVRSIVATHGGTIRASAREPRGSVFYVNLPTASASQAL